MKGSKRDGWTQQGKNLGHAKGEEETQERCRAILETIAPGGVKYSVSGGVYYIELPPVGAAWWVYLALWDDDSIGIRIYPGNTVRQARKFYECAKRDEFFALESRGWQIQSYLCLCFIAWGRPARGTKLGLRQYFDYWASEEIRQVRRGDDGFEDLSQRLRAHGLIDARDQRYIRRDFIETRRDFMNVCPGFELVFSWRRGEAGRLDRNEQFIEAVRSRANEALGTWGQSL